MAKPLRPKRGTTAKNDAFVGLASEITVDTEKHSIRVHDGVTAGGHETLMARGGVLKGAITLALECDTLASGLSANSAIHIKGGTNYADGATLALYGAETSLHPGGFLLQTDKTNNGSKALIGMPNGSLKWNDKDVITSAGGAFVSEIAIKKTTDDGELAVLGGSDQSSSRLILCGKDSANSGVFNLIAQNAQGFKELCGDVNGSLTWGGVSLTNPVGTVIAMAANSAPSGYLLCNGSAVSRTTYADLFAKIGTAYGDGDGSTTFNLPNLTDKFIQGSGTAGTVKSAGLPNIYGEFAFSGARAFYATGAFSTIGSIQDDAYGGSAVTGPAVQLNASILHSIYGSSDTVQPPALTMRMYIKY